MLRFGKINQYDAARGYAKVSFEDIGIVSDWLPVISQSTKTVISEFPIEKENQVACLMDDQCNAGVILGSVFSDDVKPDMGAEGFAQIKSGEISISVNFVTGTITISNNKCQVMLSKAGVNIDAGDMPISVGGQFNVLYSLTPDATKILDLKEIGVSQKVKVG